MSVNEDLKNAGLAERVGLIVYLKNASDQYKLRKYGDIVYFSKQMNYCMIYVDHDEANTEFNEIASLDFVKKIEISAEDNIDLTSEHIETQILDMAKKAEAELQKRQEENGDILK